MINEIASRYFRNDAECLHVIDFFSKFFYLFCPFADLLFKTLLYQVYISLEIPDGFGLKAYLIANLNPGCENVAGFLLLHMLFDSLE